MKKLIFLLLLPMGVFGMDRFSALSMLETGDDDQAIGPAGEISRYQVRMTEWQSVTNSANYCDSRTAHAVMVQIMEKRVQVFQTSFGRQPTDFEFYALWNAPTQAMQGHISPRVAERCQRFVNLCERDRQLAQSQNMGTSARQPVF
jgi:hypothetical protein